MHEKFSQVPELLTTHPQLVNLVILAVLLFALLLAYSRLRTWLKIRPKLLIVNPRVWVGDVIKDAQDKEVVLNIEFQIKNCSTRDNSVVKIKAGFETADRVYEKSVNLSIISNTSYFYVLPFAFLYLPQHTPKKPYVLRIEIIDQGGYSYFYKYPVRNINLDKPQELVN